MTEMVAIRTRRNATISDRAVPYYEAKRFAEKQGKEVMPALQAAMDRTISVKALEEPLLVIGRNFQYLKAGFYLRDDNSIRRMAEADLARLPTNDFPADKVLYIDESGIRKASVEKDPVLILRWEWITPISSLRRRAEEESTIQKGFWDLRGRLLAVREDPFQGEPARIAMVEKDSFTVMDTPGNKALKLVKTLAEHMHLMRT